MPWNATTAPAPSSGRAIAATSDAESPQSKAAALPWWNKEWPWRQVIRIEHPELAARINTASVEIDTEGHCCPKGVDCRITNEKGTLVPHAIITEKDGIVHLKFPVASSSSSLFAIYYGNPKAGNATRTWVEKTGGLILEIRDHTAGGNPANFGVFMQMLGKSKRSFGKGYVSCINQTVNPWNDQQDNYISIYKGVLYCPETGRYKFATNCILTKGGWIDFILSCRGKFMEK